MKLFRERGGDQVIGGVVKGLVSAPSSRSQ